MNGKSYSLAQNNSGHCLHGGLKGFDKQLFKVSKVSTGDDSIVLEFSYFSPDGEEGFPGDLEVKYRQFLRKSLLIDYDRALCVTM